MKKWLTVLLVLALTLGFGGTALAAKDTVSFAKSSGTVTGGAEYELSIKISKAPDADLPVEILNNTTKETLVLTIPAGESTASVMVPTERVSKSTKVVYSLVKSSEYQTGSGHTLTLNALPKMQFYALYTVDAGKEASVRIKCNTPNAIVNGSNIFQLRNQDGTVLAEQDWGKGTENRTFRFDTTEEMIGRHMLSLWLNDVCVTEEEGYLAITDPDARVLYNTEPEIPVMAMGIDCGSVASKTADVLAVLDKHNVKVTFFLTGEFMRMYPDEVQMIFEAGHEIANHSNRHDHMKSMNAYKMRTEITIIVDKCERELGVTPRLFRPPYGETNGTVNAVARAEGLEVVMWSDTYHDSSGRYKAKQIMSLATDGGKWKPGSIGLCHVYGYEQPDSLDAGLTYYESIGLQVIPISALIYASGEKLPPMPSDKEALVYTDEYWAGWLGEHYPELAAELAEKQAK